MGTFVTLSLAPMRRPCRGVSFPVSKRRIFLHNFGPEQACRKEDPIAEIGFLGTGLVPRDNTWLALSVSHLLDVLNELNHPEIEFVSFREQFDTGGPPGEP